MAYAKHVARSARAELFTDFDFVFGQRNVPVAQAENLCTPSSQCQFVASPKRR